MKFKMLNLVISILITCSFRIEANVNTNNDLVYNQPDLIIDYETDNGIVSLEAFKFKRNDLIIKKRTLINIAC